MRYIQIRRIISLPVICILIIGCFIPTATGASKGLDLLEQIKYNDVRQVETEFNLDWKAEMNDGHGNYYILDTDRNIESAVRGCFALRFGLVDSFSVTLEKDDSEENNYLQIRDGFTVTIRKPGIYKLIAKVETKNQTLDFPLWILARGKPTVETAGDFEYKLYKDGSAEITACFSEGETIRFPEVLNGHPVYRIGNGKDAVRFENGVPKRIIVPGGVQRVGRNAFCRLEGLQEVILEEGVIAVDETGIARCPDLVRVEIPSTVIDIKPDSFEKTPKLTELIVSDDNERYGIYRSFLYNKPEHRIMCMLQAGNAETIEIPRGTSIIGQGVFMDNDTIRTVILPESLRIIEQEAFYGCDGLQSISIPEGTVSIGQYAFGSCENLEKIFLPSTIIAISSEAFIVSNQVTAVVRNRYGKNFCLVNGIPYENEEGGNGDE